MFDLPLPLTRLPDSRFFGCDGFPMRGSAPRNVEDSLLPGGHVLSMRGHVTPDLSPITKAWHFATMPLSDKCLQPTGLRSEMGQKRKLKNVLPSSAHPPTADIRLF
jgi:hypothetical protein